MESLYRQLYLDLISRKYRKLVNEKDELAIHVPIIGKNYCTRKNRLMWVGRAVNGWYPVDLCCGEQHFIEHVNAQLDSPDRFSFLIRTENNRRLYQYSPFWRTCKLICRSLHLSAFNENDWFESIVWTNLYAATPYIGGNPNHSLRSAQKTTCGKLLKTQIDTYKPTHIVFVTDWDWFADFNSPAKEEAPLFPNIDKINFGNGVVVGCGYIGNIPVFVTRRPEYKFSDKDFVQAVIESIENNSTL